MLPLYFLLLLEACKQRRNRKRKRQGDADAAATATENAKTTYCSPSLLGSKKCKQEAKEHQSKETHNEEVVASSDSEPELIHADWELAEESSENDEKEIEASKDSSTEEDLDTSEQDIDEEIPKDLSSSAESESVEDDGQSAPIKFRNVICLLHTVYNLVKIPEFHIKHLLILARDRLQMEVSKIVTW